MQKDVNAVSAVRLVGLILLLGIGALTTSSPNRGCSLKKLPSITVASSALDLVRSPEFHEALRRRKKTLRKRQQKKATEKGRKYSIRMRYCARHVCFIG